jgi:hypothetical protein
MVFEEIFGADLPVHESRTLGSLDEVVDSLELHLSNITARSLGEWETKVSPEA